MFGEVTAGLSVVTVAELAHGVERAKQDAHRLYRQNFLDDLLADIDWRQLEFPLNDN